MQAKYMLNLKIMQLSYFIDKNYAITSLKDHTCASHTNLKNKSNKIGQKMTKSHISKTLETARAQNFS